MYFQKTLQIQLKVVDSEAAPVGLCYNGLLQSNILQMNHHGRKYDLLSSLLPVEVHKEAKNVSLLLEWIWIIKPKGTYALAVVLR